MLTTVTKAVWYTEKLRVDLKSCNQGRNYFLIFVRWWMLTRTTVVIISWSEVLVAQSYPTLCDPMDCSLPGSTVHEILQERLLECIAIPCSRGSSQTRDRTQVSCIAGGFFTSWAIREAHDLGPNMPTAIPTLFCLKLSIPLIPVSAPGVLWSQREAGRGSWF